MIRMATGPQAQMREPYAISRMLKIAGLSDTIPLRNLHALYMWVHRKV
jgi:hypothetical protein